MDDITKKLNDFYQAPRTQELMRKVPRVRVLDIAINKENNHWRPLIGKEGILLNVREDEEGTTCDVKMDYSEVPNMLVMVERFQMLPSIEQQESGEKPV